LMRRLASVARLTYVKYDSLTPPGLLALHPSTPDRLTKYHV
jgi:hypothetical protein